MSAFGKASMTEEEEDFAQSSAAAEDVVSGESWPGGGGDAEDSLAYSEEGRSAVEVSPLHTIAHKTTTSTFRNGTSEPGRYTGERRKRSRKSSSRRKHRQRKNWMTELAYSFRSPRTSSRKQYQQSQLTNGERVALIRSNENSPLLPVDRVARPQQQQQQQLKDYISVAAAFLMDYESSRPSCFSCQRLDRISDLQVQLFYARHNPFYALLRVLASAALFLSSFWEGFANNLEQRIFLSCLNLLAVLVLAFDLWMGHTLRGDSEQEGVRGGRLTRSARLVQPMMLFLALLCFENTSRLLVTPRNCLVLFSSVYKPLVLFYVSSRARNSFEVLLRTLQKVVGIFAMELSLNLLFAVIASRFFGDYDRFSNLSVSWLSLIEMSTVYVDPNIWKPVYAGNEASLIFFVVFLVSCVFYLKTLVLAVVFQSYRAVALEIRQRTETDRDNSIRLSYLALRYHQSQLALHTVSETVNVAFIRDTIKILRPHYNSVKIGALVDIVTQSKEVEVDYTSFQSNMRKALNASLRTTRSASPVAMMTELVAFVVAVVNCAYAIAVSSFLAESFSEVTLALLGCVISLIAATELLVRFNPFRIRDLTPLTRLDATFDGIALCSAFFSFFGIILYLCDSPSALDCIVVGRAVDMIRIMRFVPVFRSIFGRSADVVPALLGPFILVVSSMHMFIYIGIALWGTGVVVPTGFEGLYQWNTFNSYQEGAVTMFQVFIGIDWYNLAQVFLTSSRLNNELVVYSFFVSASLVGATVLVNILVAVFVEVILANTSTSRSVTGSRNLSVRRIPSPQSGTEGEDSSAALLAASSPVETLTGDSVDENSADSEGSSNADMYEFDVFERHDYNKIMRTMREPFQQYSSFCKRVSNYFETLESLTPGREQVGWLIYDHQQGDRFGNRLFETLADGFLETKELQTVVNTMHSELLALASRASFNNRSLIRRFKGRSNNGHSFEVAATYLHRHPAVSLFTSRVVEEWFDSVAKEPNQQARSNKF